MSKLLYFLLFPLRLWKKYQIKRDMEQRLENAIRKAEVLNKKFVCRNGHEYFIGDKKQMEATQKAFKRIGVRWTWSKHIEYERATN